MSKCSSRQQMFIPSATAALAVAWFALMSACAERALDGSATESASTDSGHGPHLWDAGVGPSEIDHVDPPSDLHWVVTSQAVRLVWSRPALPLDAADSYFVVCALDECAPSLVNFAEWPIAELPRLEVEEVQVSTVLPSLDLVSLPVGSLYALDRVFDLPEFEPADPIGESGGAQKHGVSLTDGVPVTVYSPVFGSIRVLGASVGSNKTDREWSFWRHADPPTHCKPANPVTSSCSTCGAWDDTNAYDINLNVTGAGSNMDKGMEFWGAGFGTARSYSGCASLNPVLVEHTGWWSFYLHASSRTVSAGDYVTPLVRLGYIGEAGAPGVAHLHFSVYTGTTASRGMTSRAVSFIANPVTITMASRSVRVGSTVTMTATAARVNHATSTSHDLSGGANPSNVNLNSSSVDANTWWKSSNTAVATVSGRGVVTGRSAGTATITVYYSGEMKTATVTVTR